MEADKKRRNYKLIVDPMLRGGSTKIYRFEGIDPTDNRPVHVRDPRSRLQRLWTQRLAADLPIPRFKYDHYYVGEPPPNEVTFTNLNDNINKDFLENMVKQFGQLEEVKIYYNPKNKKHMGIGKVIFISSKSAKMCADKLNQTSKMGNIMNVYVDSGGKDRQKIIEDMLSDQPKPTVGITPSLNIDPRTRRLSSSGPVNTSFSDTSFEQEAYDPETEFQNQRKALEINFPASDSMSQSTDVGYVSGTPLSTYSQGSFNLNQDSNKVSYDILNTGMTPGLTPAMTPNVAGSNFQFPPTPQFEHNNVNHAGYNNQNSNVSGYGNQGSNNFGNQGNNFGNHGNRGYRGFGNNEDYDHHTKNNMFGNHGKIDFSQPPPNFNSSTLPHHIQSDKNFHREDSNRFHSDRFNYRNRDRNRDNRDNRGYDRNDRSSRGGRDWRKDRNDRNFDYRDNRDSYNNRNRDFNSYNRRDRYNNRRDDRDHRERGFNHDKIDRNFDNRDNRLYDNRNSFEYDNHEAQQPVYDRDRINKARGDLMRRDSLEKEHLPPPRPKTPPMPPEPKTETEEEPRVQSLESRIQSLLQNVGGISDGFGSPSSDSTSESRKKEPTPPPSRYNHSDIKDRIPKMPIIPQENDSDIQKVGTPFDYNPDYVSTPGETDRIDRKLSHHLDFRDSSSVCNQLNGNTGMTQPSFTAQDGIPAIPSNIGVSESTTQDDDEMSISSGNSDDQNIEINPMIQNSSVTDQQNSANFLNNQQTMNPWQIQNMTMNYGSNFNNYNFMGNSNEMQVYNQALYNQYHNEMLNQSPMTGQTKAESEAMEKKFMNVLEGFVKELKSVMQKDLCKKMVENSAFKSFDGWWNDESDKYKQVQSSRLLPERLSDKSSPARPSTVTVGKSEVTSTLASLFEPQHPWGREGEMNMGGFMGGGFLGIRGGMPRLPSFKKKYRPPAAPEDEESKHSEGKVEEETPEKKSSRPSRIRKPIYSDSEDEEEESEEEEEEEEEEEGEKKEAAGSSDEEEEESEEDEESEEEEEEESSEEEEEDLKVVDEDTQKKDEEEEENITVDETKEEKLEREESDHEEISEKKAEPEKKKEVKKSPKKVAKETNITVEEPSPKDSSSAQNSEEKPEPSGFETLLKASEILSLRDLVQKPPVLPSSEDKVDEKDAEAQNSEAEKEKPSFLVEHDYVLPLPVQPSNKSGNETDGTMSAEEDENTTPYEVFMDHNYCLPPQPNLKDLVEQQRSKSENAAEPARPGYNTDKKKKEPAVKKERKRKQPLKESTSLNINDLINLSKGSRELINLLPPPKPVKKYPIRKMEEERRVFFDMYSNGIDDEDIRYLKMTYENLLESEDPMGYWINDILWVDHPCTNIPDPVPVKKRKKTEFDYPKPHTTGCARTEGYYKLSSKEKQWLSTPQEKDSQELTENVREKKTHSSREARHENRRLQVAIDESYLDLFKFNQFRLRKKQLKFARSGIHDWGLFALEPIAADEMVIEYVGESLRQSLADLREKKYEAEGCGSSYLFRVDTETIIDATKCGNLARFINHCCNPNCYAKIITVEAHKKIVIYSKRDIDVNEEITYDYKFPIEDEKIPCLCGAPNCRGTLN